MSDTELRRRPLPDRLRYAADKVEAREWRIIDAITFLRTEASLLDAASTPGEIKTIRPESVGPDDVIVLESPVLFCQKARDEISKSIRGIFGEGRRVLVLEEGIGLRVLREEP